MGYIILIVTMFGSLFGILWLNHNVWDDALPFSTSAISIILLVIVSVAIGNICMMLWYKFLENHEDKHGS